MAKSKKDNQPIEIKTDEGVISAAIQSMLGMAGGLESSGILSPEERAELKKKVGELRKELS